MIEIQIPFSEPMADGPLFLAANHAALARGVGYDASLALMHEASAAHPGVRFVFMSYLNPLYRRGYERFASEAAAAGAKGVIVPDLPLESAAPLEAALARHDLHNIRLIAPNADDARIAALAGSARGFIYAVARSGVTGAHSDFAGVQCARRPHPGRGRRRADRRRLRRAHAGGRRGGCGASPTSRSSGRPRCRPSRRVARPASARSGRGWRTQRATQLVIKFYGVY